MNLYPDKGFLILEDGSYQYFQAIPVSVTLDSGNWPLVSSLRQKLREYKSRPGANVPIFCLPPSHKANGALLKATILNELLRKGHIDLQEVFSRIMAVSDEVNWPLLCNAWGVIANYCEERGARVRGGSGLPPPNKVVRVLFAIKQWLITNLLRSHVVVPKTGGV